MGQDPLSSAVIERWRQLGIDTGLVLSDAFHNVGLYFIENDSSGERFFHYWRSDSAARYLFQHSQIDEVFANLTDYDAIFLSGISLAILPSADRKKCLAYLKTLQENGVRIVYDGNYRPKLWDDVRSAQSVSKEIYELCDLVLLTFEDEQLLWSDNDVQGTFQRLKPYEIGSVIVKDGANGCFYETKGSEGHVLPKKVECVIDTTAAGDSFNAGFLLAWLAEQPISNCAQLGNDIAGQVIQQRGAIVDIQVPKLAFLA